MIIKKQMKKARLIEILQEIGYSKSMIYLLVNGKYPPRRKNMLLLRDNYGIPLEAWEDIKRFTNVKPVARAKKK